MRRAIRDRVASALAVAGLLSAPAARGAGPADPAPPPPASAAEAPPSPPASAAEPPPPPPASATEPPAPAAMEPPAAPAAPPPPCVPKANRHDGFYLRVLSGVGFLTSFGDGPRGSASISGLASEAAIAVGGATAPGLSVAGFFWGASATADFSGGPFAQSMITSPGSTAMKKASNSATATLAELGVLADWFPDPTGGWHAGVSAGLGLTGVSNSADGSTFGGAAFAASAFGGYDFWLGRSWSLGISAIVGGATSATLNDTSNKSSGYRLTPISFGLASTLLYY